jgi:hypothetical protein
MGSAVADKELSTTTDEENHVGSRDDASHMKRSILSQAVADD